MSGEKQRGAGERGKGGGAVDQALIRELAALLSETDLTEIEIEQNGLRLRVARQPGPSVPPHAAAPYAPPPAAPQPAAAPETAGVPEADLSGHPGAVKSPMVGTAYRASEPGASPFVRDGDQVKEGQTVMIVEAMKTMNNIPAHKSGTVTRILVDNEQPVEFGDVLMIIE
ncbi:MAG: acetyl-CoA carboxylase biotin carboxyl carrier protein [Alphaproteobacteria bacterium]